MDDVIQQITYSNSSDAPPASVVIDYVFNDGNVADQGTGGALEDTGSVTVTITPQADVPVAVDDTGAIDEDTVLSVPAATGVLDNDFDPDLDTITVVASDATSSLGASVTVNADGSYSYDPTGASILQSLSPGQTVDDTFTYTVEDPSGLQDTATVTITVTGTDDGLFAGDDVAVADEDNAVTVAAPGVLMNDFDPDGAVPPAATLNYDANFDTTDDGIWTSSTGSSSDITLDASVVKNTSPTTSLPGINESYVFDGTAGGTLASFESLPRRCE